MIRTALAALCLVSAAAALEITSPWRAHPEMTGIEYSGANEPPPLNNWRHDGGLAANPALKGVILYSTADRLAVSTQTFLRNEPDGSAAWKVVAFASYPADREKTYISFGCGLGPDVKTPFESMNDPIQILGVAETASVPDDNDLFTGLIAAVRIDLQTGTIEPISPNGVYCRQELVD